MNVTRVWGKTPEGKRFLMNEITSTSRFKDGLWPNESEGKGRWTHEDQKVVADAIIHGWRTNGSNPLGTTYEIEQTTGIMMKGPSLDQTCRRAGIELSGFAL